jgi:hypothetical protein
VLDARGAAGAAAATGAAATGAAKATPIPAVANPIANSGRTDTAITFLTLTSNSAASQRLQSTYSKIADCHHIAPGAECVIPSELSGTSEVRRRHAAARGVWKSSLRLSLRPADAEHFGLTEAIAGYSTRLKVAIDKASAWKLGELKLPSGP